MGRRKRKPSEFDELFGYFRPEAMGEEGKPLMEIVQLGADEAEPCRDCGRYPRLHIANFDDARRMERYYIDDGGCGQCDGEWYSSREAAVAAWNKANKDALPKSGPDRYDLINEIMERFRIPG